MPDESMRSIRFPRDSEFLLREVATARHPELLRFLVTGRDQVFPREEALAFRLTLCREFVFSGMDEDYEPTPRGRLLNEMIDAIGDACL